MADGDESQERLVVFKRVQWIVDPNHHQYWQICIAYSTAKCSDKNSKKRKGKFLSSKYNFFHTHVVYPKAIIATSISCR